MIPCEINIYTSKVGVNCYVGDVGVILLDQWLLRTYLRLGGCVNDSALTMYVEVYMCIVPCFSELYEKLRLYMMSSSLLTSYA